MSCYEGSRISRENVYDSLFFFNKNDFKMEYIILAKSCNTFLDIRNNFDKKTLRTFKLPIQRGFSYVHLNKKLVQARKNLT